MKDLSLHILDIVQNSLKAEAKLIEIEITESKINNYYKIVIRDDGNGMSKEMLAIVTDPFTTSRTTRKVGLGLSLYKHMAELAGGGLRIDSELGKGTEVEVNMKYDHLDRPPIGDIAGVITILISANINSEFIYRHLTDHGEYVFNTREVKEVLEDVNLNSPKIVSYIKDMINENLKEIKVF